jgi:hypothetical protein
MPSNKIVHKKKKRGKIHVWNKIPYSTPGKTIDLDFSSGFYHGIPLENFLKEMNECVLQCLQ